MHFAGTQVEIDLIQCLYAGKLPGNVYKIKKQRVLCNREPVIGGFLFALNCQIYFALIHCESRLEAILRKRRSSVEGIDIFGIDYI